MKIIYLESNLFEKSTTKPDKQAMKTLVNSGLFTEEEATQIIDDLFTKKKIHAFTHSGSWMDKYIKGIARMIVDEADGNKDKAFNFINNEKTIETFDKYLTYVKANRDKQNNPSEFDKDFVDNLSFEEIKNFVNQYQDELDQQSKDELSKMEFDGNSDYELIPIDSYDELHSKFGGKLTGNGTGDSSVWCHTNSESTYNNWVDGGDKFFILVRKDFKDIPFDKESNSKNPKDEYGNSLIALLVSKYGNLRTATLRCNHVGVFTNADHQYDTYAELSKIAGFNVEKKIKELDNFEENPIKDGVYYYDGKDISYDLRGLIKRVVIKDGLTAINSNAFSECTSLTNITIPNSVTEIGDYAFSVCKSLTDIIIPDNVTKIGDNVFSDCTSLTNITISDSVTEIGDYAFRNCTSLKEIIIPDSVTEIGDYAFRNCGSLKSITIPDSVTKIGIFIFFKCPNITVKCYKGSYTERCCILDGIPYKII